MSGLSNSAQGGILSQGLFDFGAPQGTDLFARCEPFADWVDASRRQGLFPFIRSHRTAPAVETEVTDFGGHTYRGLNLASQDYLGLARHPVVVERAVAATRAHGTHSAGSEPMGGGMGDARLLECELAAFLRMPHVVLFPTGWGAGFGALKALIRPYDIVVIDALAHDCLQHGARASTPNIVPFAHNDVSSLEKRLARVASGPRNGAILVVTESLFSMDSDHPKFRPVIDVCRRHGARLLVDVAHDLGVLGPGGRGVLAEQGVAGEVDIVIGSFSKTFACIGGFAATRSKAASYYVRGFSGTYTFSNFLTPGQVGAVRAALGIVRAQEGEDLRRAVLRKAELLRSALASAGIEVSGRVSPLVLPRIGPEPVARLAQRRCLEQGVIVNSIEFPACRRGAARFRLQVSPNHEDVILEHAAHTIARAIEWAGDAVRSGVLEHEVDVKKETT